MLLWNSQVQGDMLLAFGLRAIRACRFVRAFIGSS